MGALLDRKSTRLNSSHQIISYAVFCLKKNNSLFSVRSRDKGTCDKHIAKERMQGSPNGYGCPWLLYPGGNNDNTFCGQFFECLKSCSLDNMTLKLRMIGKDLPSIAAKAKGKFDE